MNLDSEKISLEKLHFNDVEEWANFAWHYSRARFKEAFRQNGILVEDEKDVISLVELAKRGGDKSGEFKTRDNKPMKFNVLEIIKSIDDDPEELKNKFIPAKNNHLLKVNKRMGVS